MKTQTRKILKVAAGVVIFTTYYTGVNYFLRKHMDTQMLRKVTDCDTGNEPTLAYMTNLGKLTAMCIPPNYIKVPSTTSPNGGILASSPQYGQIAETTASTEVINTANGPVTYDVKPNTVEIKEEDGSRVCTDHFNVDRRAGTITIQQTRKDIYHDHVVSVDFNRTTPLERRKETRKVWKEIRRTEKACSYGSKQIEPWVFVFYY